MNLDATRTRRYDTSLWCKYGLLPYIDLRLWELMTGHHITWDVISEAIDCSIDQTRQTVHKLADELVFSGHGLATLEKAIAEYDSKK